MRVTKAAIRVPTATSQAQAACLKKILDEKLPEIDWLILAVDDVVVLETDEATRTTGEMETR